MTRPEALLLLFVLLFSPLAFGTVEPWSRAIAEGAALAGLAIALQRRTHDGALRTHAAPGTLPLLLLLGLMLLQLAPLPPALLGILSPASLRIWERTLGAAGPLPWVPISADPAATLRELVRFGAQAALYLLTVELLTRRERLRATTVIIAAFAAALALEALVQHLAAPLRLLLVRRAPFDATPFGPFVNRNHFADLMAMLAPALVGLTLGRSVPRGGETLRARVASLLSHPTANARLLLGFAALLAASSLVVSLSRGGIVAAGTGILVYGAFVLARGLGRPKAVGALLLAAGFAVFAGWFGWERIARRFATIGASGEILDSFRALAWRDTLRMAADFPLLGSGVGSFERLYPHYQSASLPVTLAHAHNDYLELLAGGGAVGLGLFLWFVLAALGWALRAARRRHEPQTLHLAYGAIGGCVAFLAHGAVDFSLAIGANALWFHFFLGLAVSAAATRQSEAEGRTLLPRRRSPAFVARAAAATAVIALLWLAADLSARHAWNLAAAESRGADALEITPGSVRRLVDLAARLQPFEARYPAAQARVASRAGDLPEAARLTARALRRSPTDPDALQQLGLTLAARGAADSARRAFESAVAFDPRGPLRREAYGSWLLARGEAGPAIAQLREALSLDAGRVPEVVALLVLAGFDDSRIAQVIPQHPAPLLAFARYLEVTGAGAQAAATYRRVLELEPGNARAAAGLRGLSRPR